MSDRKLKLMILKSYGKVLDNLVSCENKQLLLSDEVLVKDLCRKTDTILQIECDRDITRERQSFDMLVFKQFTSCFDRISKRFFTNVYLENRPVDKKILGGEYNDDEEEDEEIAQEEVDYDRLP